MPDDDGDLMVGEDDELDGTVVPLADRKVPAVIEKVTHDTSGNPHPVPGFEPYVYGLAHHNLPGFLQPVPEGSDLRPRGLVVGEAGWIPNNEEGIQAVTNGFVELIDAPADALPMPKSKS